MIFELTEKEVKTLLAALGKYDSILAEKLRDKILNEIASLVSFPKANFDEALEAARRNSFP